MPKQSGGGGVQDKVQMERKLEAIIPPQEYNTGAGRSIGGLFYSTERRHRQGSGTPERERLELESGEIAQGINSTTPPSLCGKSL